MAKMPPIRVALDLETTGLHAEHDAILEIAAIKFQGATILDTFESFVAPGRPIPYRVQRLTGITAQHLLGAPRFEAISTNLQRFIGNYAIVGHSIPFDVGFLLRSGLGLLQDNPLIDTFELATVLMPSLPSYNLGQVAAVLGVPVAPGRHRAMVDTVLAQHVFLALHKLLQAVDLSLLKDLANLDAPRSWPLLTFFRQELRERQERDGLSAGLARGSLGDRFAAQLGMDPRVLAFAVAQQHQTAPPPPLSAPLIVEAIPEQAEPDEPAASQNYQSARSAVLQAFEQRTPLLMEVTIGGNDYTPALLPALEWVVSAPAAIPPRRLVIACSQPQHARRLIEQVLPRLQRFLSSQAPVAYLEEKGGYLCVHRWFGAALRRTSGELTAEQARGLAKLGLWAQQTLTGERSELTMLPHEVAAWERISSGVEQLPLGTAPITDLPPSDGASPPGVSADTAYKRCTYQRKGFCFVSAAAARVQAASIVVTTHAGLLDDLTSPTSQLSSIASRLLLDADLLEDEIARWSSKELDQARLINLLNTIGVELPNGQFQGLLALAAPSLRDNGPGGLSTTHTIARSEVDARMQGWFQAVRHACASVDTLFSTFAALLEEYLQQSANGHEGDKKRSATASRSHGSRLNERTDQPLRLTGQARNFGSWTEVERAWQQAAGRLQSVIDLVHEAERLLLRARRTNSRLEQGSGEEEAVAAEFAASAQRLLEQKNRVQQALSLSSSDSVYWLRVPPPPPPNVQQMASQRQLTPPPSTALPVEHFPVLYTQHVQTSAIVKNVLLHDRVTAVFAGAALAVDSAFTFYRAQLGLTDDPCPTLSVVTDRHDQTLLYLPNDVPEPNTAQYQRHLDEALIQLARALEGQVVALFTSHAALRSSYATIKPALEARDILVLGQGIDGSPRQVWHMFSTQERVVALGVGSFWDSIGDITSIPACIFITRLPMPVLNDPPLAARAEGYSDQLRQLTVPLASLRLRRVLNRMAWSTSRRNAVVLFDRRLLSRDYGATILHSLPRCSQRQDAVSHMPETILDWLTTTGSWEVAHH